MTVEGGVVASTVSPALGRDLSLEAAGRKLKVIGGEGGLSVEGGFSGGGRVSKFYQMQIYIWNPKQDR